jgi:hypothetical protein
MKIEKFFNPRDMRHIIAYQELQNTGVWPKGFISEDLEFGPGWQALIAFKIADVYIEEKLGDHC